MQAASTEAFPLGFDSLITYRSQPDGVNPRPGAKNEPLTSGEGEFAHMHKYVESWLGDSFDVEVSYGHETTFRVPLRELVYRPGEHTAHRLKDLDTGEVIQLPCARYGIYDQAVFGKRLVDYVHNNDQFIAYALACEPEPDAYLEKLYTALLQWRRSLVSFFLSLFDPYLRRLL